MLRQIVIALTFANFTFSYLDKVLTDFNILNINTLYKHFKDAPSEPFFFFDGGKLIE